VISGETRLVGLLGDPVSGSLSPPMQNAAFAARGLDRRNGWRMHCADCSLSASRVRT